MDFEITDLHREVSGNLPAESNIFIGRGRDLADLVGMLDRVRAVTLCGPGGIGKTRLAVRLGSILGSSCTDGAWIADLADAESADRLVPLVAGCLGIRAEPDRPLTETIVEALRPRDMILILDTCEHLIAASAEFADSLLRSCPKLRVVATSREPLKIRGEVIWRVPPLGLPDPGARLGADPASEAVSLFTARAVAVRPDFELTDANRVAVAEICRALDGVPLAIELAAARVRTLPAEQLLVRLARRFELLAVGDRTAPPRQQTLRATVAWSYESLTEPERLMLRRLSVFHGWSLEAAEQVCADEAIPVSQVLELLTALIDKSLVTVDYEVSGTARYRLLDTVRQFALEQVSDSAELDRNRLTHADSMLALVEGMVHRAIVPDQASWQERVDSYHGAMADWANFELALTYYAERRDAERGLRLCNAMAISWLLGGDQSGAAWMDRFLASGAEVPADLRARAQVVRSELAFEQRDFDLSEQYAAQAASYTGKNGNLAGAQRMLAVAALVAGRADEAIRLADLALTTARETGDSWDEGVVLGVRGAIIASQGDVAGARLAYRQALEILADGRGWGVANLRYGIGRLDLRDGDQSAAIEHFSVALTLYSQVGHRPQMARCHACLGQLAMARGDLNAARASFTECMRLSLETGQRLAIARSLAAMALLCGATGDLPAGVRLAGTTQALCQAMSAPLPSPAKLARLIEEAQSGLGQQAVAVLLAEGKRTSPHQAAQAVAVAPARTGPAAPSAPELTWPGPLTDREQEVARLVADGLSNRVIGETLDIAETTAARHVANIFAKLGFRSRAQLIAWVVSGTRLASGARSLHA